MPVSLTLKIEHSDKLEQALKRITGAQAQKAYGYAVSDTAYQARRAVQNEMKSVFDRVTPYVRRSVWVDINRRDLTARIMPTYQGGQGVDPQKILQAQEFGGQRAAKRSEVVLQQVGLLPPGWVTVPSRFVRLDRYGNMSSGQLMQILSQLRAKTTAGYTRNMAPGKRGIAAQRRAGGRYFVIPPGGRTQPGIYQREFMGRDITPLLIFVRGATYRPLLGMERIAKKANLQEYLGRRVRYRIYRQAEGKDQ